MVPFEAVDAATRSTVLWVAAVALCGILAVVWLLVRMANTLGSRIRSVGGLARQVADGDLTVEADVDSDDEIGALRTAIRDMVLNLSSLLGKVKHSSIRLTSTSNDVVAGRRAQESAIENFGSSTAEITTAAKQISGTSRDLLHTMSDLNRVAGESAALAGEGRQGLTRMAATTDHLNEVTGAIAARLAKISEKAKNINVVVTTIVKVADQTNLLSLNASIEAEKAGEHGLGFSVVAQEIRRLADQTAVATLDIEKMIQQMQSSVASGVTEMGKFTGQVRGASDEVRRVGQQLESIIDEVRELTERFQTVTEGMESQAEGGRQIRDALVNLSDGVQQTMRTLKDYRRAGDNLDKAVRDLRGEIARFKMKSGDVPVTPVAEG
jgi:methyl-accepting chemotaxis protein WspA